MVAGEGIACTDECNGTEHSSSCQREKWGLTSTDEGYYTFLMALAEEKEDVPAIPHSRLAFYSAISG